MVAKKAIRVIAIILSVAIVLGGAYIGYQISYLNNIFYGEDFIKSDDEEYSYLEFSSPKKLITTIAIYSRLKLNPATDGYTNIFLKFLETNSRGGDVFRNRAVRKISWGVNTYDLFFDHVEKGVFCYQYIDGEWIGEMLFDMERTKNEISKGNSNIYYFSGDREVDFLKSATNPAGFERILGEIKVESIPKYFLDKLNAKMGVDFKN